MPLHRLSERQHADTLGSLQTASHVHPRPLMLRITDLSPRGRLTQHLLNLLGDRRSCNAKQTIGRPNVAHARFAPFYICTHKTRDDMISHTYG